MVTSAMCISRLVPILSVTSHLHNGQENLLQGLVDSGALPLVEGQVSGVASPVPPLMLGLASGVTVVVTLLGHQLASGVILLVLTLMLGTTVGAAVLVTLLRQQLVLLQGLELGKDLGLRQGNSTVREDKCGGATGSPTQTKIWVEHLPLEID